MFCFPMMPYKVSQFNLNMDVRGDEKRPDSRSKPGLMGKEALI